VALIVLLLVFRSAWAAALPIVTGVIGVAVSSMAVLLLSHVITLSSVSLSLGAVIGLGVGIDYALLIVNRYIRGLREGADVETGIAASMNTSGRSVIFAGGTVIVALLGMLTLGFGFLSGMAIGAAVTVLLTVATALTLLPAFLGKAGPRVLRRSECAAWQPGHPLPGGGGPRRAGAARGGGAWGRWARFVQRRPVPTGVAALAVLLLLASPVMSLRLGSADASSDAAGSTTRTFYNDGRRLRQGL
jgi:RND superfamily putative drug exporter